jgi:hypothetical protein
MSANSLHSTQKESGWFRTWRLLCGVEAGDDVHPNFLPALCKCLLGGLRQVLRTGGARQLPDKVQAQALIRCAKERK